MDYDWRSWFFICPDYPERWGRLLGSDYREEVEGPKLRSFANVLGSFEAFTPRETTMESYLIGRTFG